MNDFKPDVAVGKTDNCPEDNVKSIQQQEQQVNNISPQKKAFLEYASPLKKRKFARQGFTPTSGEEKENANERMKEENSLDSASSTASNQYSDSAGSSYSVILPHNVNNSNIVNNTEVDQTSKEEEIENLSNESEEESLNDYEIAQQLQEIEMDSPKAYSSRQSRRNRKDVNYAENDDEDDEDYVEEEEEEEEEKKRQQGNKKKRKSKGDDSQSRDTPKKKKKEKSSNRSSKSKIYDSVKGTTCHQCKQKTLDEKTHCKFCVSISNSSIRGAFCGSCLKNRYGEEIEQVLQTTDWKCPICRNICNCSSCRRKAGKFPISITTREALKANYKCVNDMLIAQNNQ
ncbi:hypothetical protein ABK040_010298 [Willaertia magna]